MEWVGNAAWAHLEQVGVGDVAQAQLEQVGVGGGWLEQVELGEGAPLGQ